MKMSYLREGLWFIFCEDPGPGKSHGALGCESVGLLENIWCLFPCIENDRRLENEHEEKRGEAYKHRSSSSSLGQRSQLDG